MFKFDDNISALSLCVSYFYTRTTAKLEIKIKSLSLYAHYQSEGIHLQSYLSIMQFIY